MQMSVLVVSCDKYSDVWDLFFKLFWRHWSDCPYPVYLGANFLNYFYPRVTTLLVGEDLNWGGSTRRMVEQIQSPYILLFLDDHFLLQTVRTDVIEACLKALHGLGGGYLRLDPEPPPDRPVPGFVTLGAIESDSPYRCSLHVSIWRRDVLLTLLREGETAWDMELVGSRRSGYLETGFYATWKHVLRYDCEGIVRGKWTSGGLRLAHREGMPVDFSRRPSQTRFETAVRRLQKIKGRLFALIPWGLRKPILKARLRRAAYS